MKIITVQLKFEGEAQVEVPDGLSDIVANALAEKIAVAKALATFDNPDCGEALEAACQEIFEEHGVTEVDFDLSTPIGIGGVWHSSAIKADLVTMLQHAAERAAERQDYHSMNLYNAAIERATV